MNGLVYPNSQEPDSAIQAMNEELVKIQEGIYYGHIGSNTDILEKFLSESGHPRYNPQIIYSGKGHQKFVSLCASVAKKDSVIMKLQYLHSPETENDVKPVTHLLAVDLTSKRGLKFLHNGIRYLLDGSRRARVGILYNMDNLDSLSEQSPPFLLMKVIDSAVSSVRDHGKALHFLNQLIVWYESQHISSSQGSDPIVSNFIEEVTKLAESSDLKSEKLKSELSVGTWDI